MIPDVDVTYFFSPNLAVEWILTYPQKQTVLAGGASAGKFKVDPLLIGAGFRKRL